MTFVFVSFCTVFLLLAASGVWMVRREAVSDRIRSVITSGSQRKGLIDSILSGSFSFSSLVEWFEQLLPRSNAEVSILKQRLTRAGFREESAVRFFYGTKIIFPLAFTILASVTGITAIGPIFVYPTCIGGGFLLPDFWLGRKIKRRQSRIRRGLPDVLDLLVICVEAGLSLDHATVRTAKEMERLQPDLCDELGMVVLEQHAGRPRSEAWKSMAERTGEESVRNLVGMLVQVEQLGTSVARTLRVQSDTLRTKRVQHIEEMAAKTSVKLVFPLVFFIFPAVFLVALGPSAIMMYDAFSRLINQ
jgi:tight adherence protein C